MSVALRGKGEVHREFWWRSLKKTDNLEDLEGEGTILLQYILRNMVVY
jgi:hypothetical protein